MEKKVLSSNLKKMCLKKILSSNLHLGGSEKSCVAEMQHFVAVIKQNRCILDIKFFWEYFIQAFRFLLIISRCNEKVFFLGLPLGLENSFMQLLKKLNKFNLLKSYVIKQEITGILTNFRKLKFKQKLEGATSSALKKGLKCFFITLTLKENFFLTSKENIYIKSQKTFSKWFKSKKQKNFLNLKSKRWVIESKESLKKFRILNFRTKPALLFVFQPLEHKDFLEKLKCLNIPTMGFVNTNDPINYYDFPIPGNTNTLKGRFFVYNIFYQLFRFRKMKFLPKIIYSNKSLKREDKNFRNLNKKNLRSGNNRGSNSKVKQKV